MRCKQNLLIGGFRIIQALFILLLTTSSLLAQGSIFGFHAPPCAEGASYDSEQHYCFYCPKGSKPLDDSFSENKKCVEIPVLGNLCPSGKGAWFDEEKHLCLYCVSGYIFSYNHKFCYK